MAEVTNDIEYVGPICIWTDYSSYNNLIEVATRPCTWLADLVASSLSSIKVTATVKVKTVPVDAPMALPTVSTYCRTEVITKVVLAKLNPSVLLADYIATQLAAVLEGTKCVGITVDIDIHCSLTNVPYTVLWLDCDSEFKLSGLARNVAGNFEVSNHKLASLNKELPLACIELMLEAFDTVCRSINVIMIKATGA